MEENQLFDGLDFFTGIRHNISSVFTLLNFIMKYAKIIAAIFLAIIFFSLASILTAGFLVKNYAKDKLYNSVEEIPYNKVGLLLGTAKVLPNGLFNLYYRYRINAAIELYNAKKIEFVLVSGDNATKYYNEPATIKRDLIERGIPAEKIFLDYAGFRTFDSIIRSKEVFGQTSITVISQKFHNERAIYIAKNKGINAIGFNARDVYIKYGLKTQIREKFARVKMLADLIFGKQPKFLGEKIPIE